MSIKRTLRHLTQDLLKETIDFGQLSKENKITNKLHEN